MYQEVDIVEIFRGREEREKKAAELKKQADAEMELIKQRYRKILDEYYPARDEMQRMANEFNKKWDLRLANYYKEVKTLNTKYRRMFKAL